MNKWIIIAILLLVLSPSVLAKEAHMKLLAVSQTPEGLKPAAADLYLEIQEGRGRVFINTFPLTKVDTQVSFRMAKEFACDFLNYDCNRLDFFYMLRSDAPIVGGPSAGAAATSLTVILLDDLSFDEKSSVTGTINSGGIIGPVAGIKEKIDAASQLGLTKVLIPEGKRFSEINTTQGNETLDLFEYGNALGIEVKEVSDITQSVFELTGANYSTNGVVLELDPIYIQTMEKIADNLCQRSKDLLLQINAGDVIEHQDSLLTAENLTMSASKARGEGSYYSAASYCYSANVRYQQLLLASKNMTNGEIIRLFDDTERVIREENAKLTDFEYNTITDLQTFLVVKERLTEAEELLDEAREYLVSQRKEDTVFKLATSIERINSARSWSEFFGKPSQKFHLDQQSLKQLCLNKIAEAEERLQYTSSFVAIPFTDMRDELRGASDNFDAGEYEVCIYKASKVKARADLIMSTIGLNPDDVARLLERKLAIVEQIIVQETQRGIFPIMGYSYFEYAKSLGEEDPISALLYSEYALELSNFDMYFKAEKRFDFEVPDISFDVLFFFVFGASIGFLFAMSLKLSKRSLRKRKRLKRRKSRLKKRR